MGLFGPKTLYTAKQMSFKDEKNSSAMKDILKKEGVAKILDKPEERKEFYNLIQKKAGGKSVDVNTIRKALGDLRRGMGKSIDSKEAMGLAGALVQKNIDRYIFEKPEKAVDRPAFGRASYAKAPSVSRLSPGANFNSRINLKSNTAQLNGRISSLSTLH